MNNRGVSIKYGDVAPEAKENFKPTSNFAKFDTLAQLQQYNLNFPNYANPCEPYSVVLDGRAVAFPSVPEDANLGLYSEELSGEDGSFSVPIVLELQSEGLYFSKGLTFTFDIENQIYPTHINIKWFRIIEDTTTELSPEGGVDFFPDNAFYFCDYAVNKYNKLIVTFDSLNMPFNRLKLRVVDYGYGTYFYGDELRNVKLIQEIDPNSAEITINTADFTIDSKSDMTYSFQKKQPLSVYFNGELKATTFVKTAKRTAKNIWEVRSEDYIGLMDGAIYFGGVYEDKNAVELLQDIFAASKVPYHIDSIFAEETLSGHIPYGSCREALMQVAFALGAVVDTSNSDKVNIYALSNDLTQKIGLDRIMQGQNFVDDDTVTSVEVVAHEYTPKKEFVELYGSESKNTGVVGEEVFVKFSEPVWDLTLFGGKMLDSSANHAHFVVTSTLLQLSGLKYRHVTETRQEKNQLLLETETENAVRVDNATLVSIKNVDKIVKRCYNWYMKTMSTNLSIVEGKTVTGGETITYGSVMYGEAKYGGKSPTSVTYDKRVNVGDIIEAETEYLGTVSGRVIRESFNLNGGIIIKEAVVK